jgi:oligopeptidase B
MLVTAGLHDPRVGYWEPAKFVAKLRAHKTNNKMLLMRTDMGAGHFRVTGRCSKASAIDCLSNSGEFCVYVY